MAKKAQPNKPAETTFPSVSYQRGDTIINGTTKHDNRLKYIDLVGSKLIKIFRLPAAGFVIEEIVRRYLLHH